MRTLSEIIQTLDRTIRYGLPGETVQMKMAPAIRKPINEYNFDKLLPANSAVLALLYPNRGSVSMALIKRNRYKGVHSGQVCFPGGKVDASDRSLLSAAIRETEEELGINASLINVIGELSKLYIPVSNFLVYPFIGYVNDKPDFLIDNREVEELIEADIMHLANPKIISSKKIKMGNGMILETPCYEVNGNVVWGATAMIICEINALLRPISF